MTYSAVSDTLVEVGKPTKREIFTGINANQADHETRVASLETGASKVIVFDEIIELDRSRAGDVKFSFLTTTQYQTKFGTDWVAIDGSSISGSDLASLYGATLPNGTDRFPRILGGAKSVGQLETSQNKAHTHAHGSITTLHALAGGGSNYPLYGGSTTPTQNFGTTGGSTASDGGTEARPDSLILQAFTRKNDYEIDQAKLFRSPFGFNLTSAIVTTLLAGTSGTLEIDVKIGSTLGSLATVFSTKPSVTQASGNNTSSSNAVFGTNAIALDDWIQIDITALQVQQFRFHLALSGELT